MAGQSTIIDMRKNAFKLWTQSKTAIASARPRLPKGIVRPESWRLLTYCRQVGLYQEFEKLFKIMHLK
jgi:hypothetical protein